jgi:hypothetical protein
MWMIKAVDLFTPHNDVIIFDFRWHGESGEKFSWSAKEYLDYAIKQDIKK